MTRGADYGDVAVPIGSQQRHAEARHLGEQQR
jgi:hypothetical protein